MNELEECYRNKHTFLDVFIANESTYGPSKLADIVKWCGLCGTFKIVREQNGKEIEIISREVCPKIAKRL